MLRLLGANESIVAKNKVWLPQINVYLNDFIGQESFRISTSPSAHTSSRFRHGIRCSLSPPASVNSSMHLIPISSSVSRRSAVNDYASQPLNEAYVRFTKSKSAYSLIQSGPAAESRLLKTLAHLPSGMFSSAAMGRAVAKLCGR